MGKWLLSNMNSKTNARTTNKLPQHIKNAIRRRAAAAEQWNLADDRITAYCQKLGLNTEFANRNVESLFRYFDPDFFVHDLEECLQRKTQKGVDT